MPHYPLFPPIGQPFIVLPVVDSTNNYAMAQLQQGLAGHGSTYFALEQTEGRGQRGKQWLTEPAANIMMSIVVEPGRNFISSPFIFTASIALACYDFYKKYALADSTRIKWPNDLYWQDRKAGGVLVESVVRSHKSLDVRREASDVSSESIDESDQSIVNSLEDQGPLTTHHSPLTIEGSPRQNAHSRWIIIGIGININQTAFDPLLKNPVSMKQITGKDWDPIILAKDLCSAIEFRYKQYLLLSPAEIIAEYQSILYKKDQKVRLKKDNAVFETTVKGVSFDGRLLTKDAIDHSWGWGEVEWLGV